MGFPYDEAAWSVVDGAMFMGWGTAMPGVYFYCSSNLRIRFMGRE